LKIIYIGVEEREIRFFYGKTIGLIRLPSSKTPRVFANSCAKETKLGDMAYWSDEI